jgi:hypothetical protein
MINGVDTSRFVASAIPQTEARGSRASGDASATRVTKSLSATTAAARQDNASLNAGGCETCSTRNYVDGSTDPGVSFKSPAHIDPSASAAVVSAHENEHVSHENAAAKQQGGRVVAQSVSLHSAVCPDCGRSYIAGGTTKTVTKTEGSEVNTGLGQFIDQRS